MMIFDVLFWFTFVFFLPIKTNFDQTDNDNLTIRMQ